MSVLRPGRFFKYLPLTTTTSKPTSSSTFTGTEPVDASGFHRHRANAIVLQPIPQGMQLIGDRAEDFRRSVGDGNVQVFAAHVDGRSSRIQNRQRRGRHPNRISRCSRRRARPGPRRNKSFQREALRLTNQLSCRWPEPIYPTSGPCGHTSKDYAVTLRSRSDAASSTRFMVPTRVNN